MSTGNARVTRLPTVQIIAREKDHERLRSVIGRSGIESVVAPEITIVGEGDSWPDPTFPVVKLASRVDIAALVKELDEQPPQRRLTVHMADMDLLGTHHARRLCEIAADQGVGADIMVGSRSVDLRMAPQS